MGLPVAITLAGSPDTRSEVLLAYEAGYRLQPAPWLTLDVTGFHNDYRSVQSVNSGVPVVQLQAIPPTIIQPLYFANNNSVRSEGVEVAANWTVRPKWRISGSYGGLRVRWQGTGASTPLLEVREGADNPAHQFNIRSQWDATRILQIDGGMYYVGGLSAVNLPSYVRLDARIGLRLLENLELSLVGQNLGTGRHREFIPEALFQESEVGRSAYARLTWRF
jgi:iron complex outermembrane receptor protein